MMRAYSGSAGLAALVLALIVLPTVALGEHEDAQALAQVEQLLGRMRESLATRNFDGTLVHLHDGHLEAHAYAHRVTDHGVQEQLHSLTGPTRVLSFGAAGVTCVLPDQHPIVVQPQAASGRVLGAPMADLEGLSRHYAIQRLGRARVAGRDAEVVGAIPLDGLRYGYHYFLDAETGVPLRSLLTDGERGAIEQVMFTEIDIEPSTLSGAAALSDAAGAASPPEPVDAAELSPWSFDGLPPGFEVRMIERRGEGRQVLLSDGLASVSVHLEKGAEPGLDGVTRMGAVHAAGAWHHGFQVTVVGEVPEETVRRVLAALRHAEAMP